jgi:hypothetical protein
VPQYAKPFRVPTRENACGTGLLQRIGQGFNSLFQSITGRDQKNQIADNDDVKSAFNKD